MSVIAKEGVTPHASSELFNFFPQNLKARLFLFSFFPFLFSLITIFLSHLRPSGISLYFPLILGFGVLACIRWKTAGLCVTYAVVGFLLITLCRSCEAETRGWHLALLFNMALIFYIVMLVSEEITESIERTLDKSRILNAELNQASIDFSEQKKKWAEATRDLQKEIELLKEQGIEEAENKVRDKERIGELYSEMQQTIIKFQLGSPTHQTAEIKTLQHAHARAQGLYKQLRTQFEEKSSALTTARKELFDVQGKLQVLEKEKENEYREELDVCGKEIARLVGDVTRLEEEVVTLEGLISHILSQ